MIEIRVIVAFLMFNTKAIRAVAASRTATLIGFLFVISASFAREYDGEYLLAHPWHLLLPLAASLLGCCILSFLIFVIGRRCGDDRVGFFPTFRSFLNLYWMTAPMAWLYAIPFERFLSPGDATRANLFLLAIVALWRVALMVKCVMVIYRSSVWTGLMPVMLFCTSTALAALYFVPGPIFAIMGGVRLSDSELAIQATRFVIGFLATASFPVWLIGFCVVAAMKKKLACRLSKGPLLLSGASRGAWLLVFAGLLIWVPILPFTQSEQRLRYQAESFLYKAHYDELCDLLESHMKDDFPPHWDPPPRVGYGETKPELMEAAYALIQRETPDWFWSLFELKLVAFAGDFNSLQAPGQLKDLSDEDLEEFVSLLEVIPNGDETALRIKTEVDAILEADAGDGAETLESKRRSLLLRLKELRHPNEVVPSESEDDLETGANVGELSTELSP